MSFNLRIIAKRLMAKDAIMETSMYLYYNHDGHIVYVMEN